MQTDVSLHVIIPVQVPRVYLKTDNETDYVGSEQLLWQQVCIDQGLFTCTLHATIDAVLGIMVRYYRMDALSSYHMDPLS